MGNRDIEKYIWRERDRFYRLAYSYVRNTEDALDIVSESIVKALKSHKDLRNKDALRPWFYSIVVNTAYDFLRKNKRIVYADDLSTEAAREDRHEDIDLAYAMTRLPEQLRTIVILRYLEDMKIREIACVLDENISTVKSRLYRALKLLRIELGDGPEGGEAAPGGGHGHE